MSDAPSKIRWDMEDVVLAAAKLFRKTDNDIIEYLKDKPTSAVVRAALTRGLGLDSYAEIMHIMGYVTPQRRELVK